MLKEKRLQEIMHILHLTGKIKTIDLAKQMYVSQSTLRRDLIQLENQNLISRKFGYVSLLEKNNLEFPYLLREQQNEEQKKVICKKASQFIKSNMAIFLDSSSTTNFIPDFLTNKDNLIFITNGMLHAYKLSKLSNVRLYLLGGNTPTNFGGSVGSETIEQINNYSANLAFVSFASLLNDHVYITNKEQANFRLAMIANAKESILLMDSSKFGQSDFIRVGNIKMFSRIITDKEPTKSILNTCKKYNIKICW